MKTFRWLLVLAQLSLIYNTTLLVSVFLNLDWVKTRAAGGQFDSFPVILRFVYLIMAVGMVYLMILIRGFFKGLSVTKSQVFLRNLGVLFSISFVMQLISRSANERWNAIPAAMIAATFFAIYKRSGD